MFKKIIAIAGTLAIAASLSVVAVPGVAEAADPVAAETSSSAVPVAADTTDAPQPTADAPKPTSEAPQPTAETPYAPQPTAAAPQPTADTTYAPQPPVETPYAPQPSPTPTAIPQKCIPSSMVTYTYNPALNNGAITVPVTYGYSLELCRGFYVTATSWKFMTADNQWPQSRDQVQLVNGGKITEAGVYLFEATVSCGQGDIYASYTAQPAPTPTLSQSRGFPEEFLHDMGFTGPAGPTYTVDPVGCNLVTPVAPSVINDVACDVAPPLVPASTIGVNYSVEIDSVNGNYIVTATPQANYFFAGDSQKISYTVPIGVAIPCKVNPDVVATFGECTRATIGGDGPSDGKTTRPVTLTFDNSKSEKSVVFQVSGPSYTTTNTTVAAGSSVDLVALGVAGGSLTVTAAGESFSIVIPLDCGETPPATGVASASVTTTPATCEAAESGVVVTVANATSEVIYPTTGSYKVVATAIGNNLFANGESTLVIEGDLAPIVTEGCQLPPLAIVTPTYSTTQATCVTGATYTLGSVVGDIMWTINGKSNFSSGTYAAPADFSDVTISATPAVLGDGLDPDWVNPVVLTFAAPAAGCSFNPPTLAFDPPTLAFDPPTLAYTGLSVGAGLSLAGGLLFVGFAGLFVARRRTLQG